MTNFQSISNDSILNLNKPKEKNFLIRGAETNFCVLGQGEPVLILHGWPASSYSWREVQNQLSQNGYKVFCPDIPGFGKSQNPPTPWDVSDYEDWFLKFVDFLNLKEFNLIAHSFGGRIAAKFIIDYPLKIKKVILCAPAGMRIKPDFKTKIIFLISSLAGAIFSIKPFDYLKNQAKNLFYFLIRKRDYAKAKGVMRETMKKVLQEDLSSYFSKIKKPTLLLWGDKDKMIPLEYGQALEKQIKNSRLKVFQKAGHSINVENPQKLSQEIIQFLKN